MFGILTPFIFVTPGGIAFVFALMSYWYKTKPNTLPQKVITIIKAAIYAITFIIGFEGGLLFLYSFTGSVDVPMIAWIIIGISAIIFTIMQAIWPVFPNR